MASSWRWVANLLVLSSTLGELAQAATEPARLVNLSVQPPPAARRSPPGNPSAAAALGGSAAASPRSIRLTTSQKPVYTVIHMSSPERVVIDVADTWTDDLTVPGLDPHDALFASLDALQVARGESPIARLIVTLHDGVLASVGSEGKTIVVRARSEAPLPRDRLAVAVALRRLQDDRGPSTPTKAAVVPPAASIAAAPPPPTADPAAQAATTPQPVAAQKVAPAPRPAERAARLVGVIRLPAGPLQQERYGLNLQRLAAAPPAPQTFCLADPRRFVVDLPGVSLPDLQPLVRMQQPLVAQVRLGRTANGTRAVFDLRRPVTAPQLSVHARGLTVAFTAKAPATSAPRPSAPLAAIRQPTAEVPLQIKVAAPQTAAFVSTLAPLARSAAVGDLERKISLDVRDADIMNVLRLISEETGENIIASDEVKGRVTLRLRQVPASQALDTLLRTKGFDRVRQNNIIRVATAEAIQKERDMDMARRRAALELEETVIRMETVNYANATEIIDQIKPMLTGRGSIQVNSRTNTLILQDLPANVERLVGLTRRLDKQTPLVMIQARIVEANSSSMQDLGIQWGGSSQETSRTHNPTGLMFPGDVVLNGAADAAANQVAGIATPAHYAVNLPATLSGQGAGLGFILGSANGSQILNLRLSAMESNGNGKVISSPEVATLDNKTARVSQGVEIPVSVTSAAGVNTRFIPAVLELEVTPHVTNDGTVLLRIKTQKSEADFTNRGAAGDPTIQKRYAETEVLVRDGDTSVIGGIYTRNTGDTYNSVPFLSRIPLIGNLFRRHAHSDTRAELLVFITPRIINREESMLHTQE